MFRLALRNVLRHKRRTLQCTLTMGLAVLLALFARGLTAGLERVAGEQVALGQYGALLVHKRGFTENVNASPLAFSFPCGDALLRQVRAVPGVVAASPRIGYSAMANLGDKTIATPVLGVDPDAEIEVCPLKKSELSLSRDGSAASALLLRQLGGAAGDELVLLSVDGDGVMNAETTKISGVMRSVPLLMPNKKLLVAPIGTVQALLRVPGQALELAVAVKDFQHPEETAAALRAALGPSFEVHTWRERAKSLMDTMRQRSVVMAFITDLILLLALVGVSNTLLLSVSGRVPEIGTMMAFGMRRRDIAGMFASEALLMGVAGAGCGTLAGIGLIAWSSAVGLPLKVPGADIIFVLHPVLGLEAGARVVTSVLLGTFIATLYPAWRASRMRPIQALSA